MMMFLLSYNHNEKFKKNSLWNIFVNKKNGIQMKSV